MTERVTVVGTLIATCHLAYALEDHITEGVMEEMRLTPLRDGIRQTFQKTAVHALHKKRSAIGRQFGGIEIDPDLLAD